MKVYPTWAMAVAAAMQNNIDQAARLEEVRKPEDQDAPGSGGMSIIATTTIHPVVNAD